MAGTIGEIKMNRADIVIALSYHPDIQKDVDYFVCRISGIGKRHPLVDRLQVVIDAENKVIDFIKNSMEIWADTGSRPTKESKSSDYLRVFKQYERLWASRKHEGTAEKNWHKMQDELANYINNYLTFP